MNYIEELNNERKLKQLDKEHAINKNDPYVTLQGASQKADKFEYKRVTVSEKERIRQKMQKMEEDATLLGPGRRPLRWFNGEKISEKLGMDQKRLIVDGPNKPHIVQHYEMQQDIADNLTLKFTGKAGRASAQAQMKDLVKKFDDSKKRIHKLKLYKELIQIGEQKQIEVNGGRDFTTKKNNRLLIQSLAPSASHPSLPSGNSPSKQRENS